MKRGLILALCLISLILHMSCSEDSVTGPTLLPPTVTSITPNRVSRGEQVVATIVGTNFTGARQVYLGNEVTVETFTVINPTTIEVRFKVNANASAGKRPVEVTTTVGLGGASNLLEVLNNRVPTSRFVVFPDKGAVNTVYTFDGSGSNDPDGNIASYQWDFGDGKTGVGEVVTHRYQNTGNYQVTLQAVDNDDSRGTSTQELTVRGGSAPSA